MHELASQVLNLLLLAAPSSGSSSADDSALKVAVVTAVGVVLAAAITAFASTFQRERSARSTQAADQTFTKQYIETLQRDQRELRRVQLLYTLLREGCFENNVDPDVLIAEQEEDRRRNGRS